MTERPGPPAPSNQVLLSKVSRYEALFELAAVINQASDIESVGQALAGKLKYIADVYAWRYACFDGDPADAETTPPGILVDAQRGRATIERIDASALTRFELGLWNDRKTRILSGEAMRDALAELPPHFEKKDLEQISVNTLVEGGQTRALYLFCRRRAPLNELDHKCLSMVCDFFHRKIHMLWEQQKLRDLQDAYLQQEAMLRQSEKLADLGRMSAGMAHELNNPAAAARQATEHLRTSIARLERARFALGAAGLDSSRLERVARFDREAEERTRKPSSLDPVTRSDLEEEVEEWLDGIGVEDPWEHAPTLVTMGLCAAELRSLTEDFDGSVVPMVIDSFTSRFTVYTLLTEIGHGAQRIAEIVKALKGYSFMDQAPIQAVDVREGLNDTLVMLGFRLKEGIDLDLDFATDLPGIQGYGSELNQVWTNLVDNAISAMKGKGVLRLKTYRDGDHVVVEVADTGPGIPPENQGKVFDPFFTTKAPGEGTGMGLNITHGIVVKKHGGQISVDSRPGDTRFTVKLPIDGPSQPRSEPSGNTRRGS